MNLEWITSPLAIYASLAAGGSAALHLVVSTRIEMRRQQKRYLAENESLKSAVTELTERVQQMGVEMSQMTAPLPAAPFLGLNIQKRAEAMRMYRRGNDQHTVSATLGLPSAEVALLAKIHHLVGHEASPRLSHLKQRVPPAAN